jgi:hypothetical protein
MVRDGLLELLRFGQIGQRTALIEHGGARRGERRPGPAEFIEAGERVVLPEDEERRRRDPSLLLREIGNDDRAPPVLPVTVFGLGSAGELFRPHPLPTVDPDPERLGGGEE